MHDAARAATVDPGRDDPVIDTPTIDWAALSPELVLLAAAAIAMLFAVLVPKWLEKQLAAIVCALGFAGALIAAGVLYNHSADGHAVIAGAIQRDQLAALAQMIIAGAGLLCVAVAYSGRGGWKHAGEFFALLASAGAGMIFLVAANNLMTLFLGLEWFSISLYILARVRRGRGELAGGRAQVPDRGELRLRRAPVRLRARLRDDRPPGLRRDRVRRPHERPALHRRARDDHRRARVQGLRRAVPHVDARRLRGRADRRDRVHVRGDEDRGARPDDARAHDRVPGPRAAVDDRRRRPRRRLTRGRQPRRARPAARQTHARVLVDLARRLHADRDRRRQRARRPRAPLLPDRLLGDVDRRLRGRRGAGSGSWGSRSRSTTSPASAGSGRSSASRCGRSCSASPACR